MNDKVDVPTNCAIQNHMGTALDEAQTLNKQKNENKIETIQISPDAGKKFRIQAASFLGLVGGVSALIGFSHTLAKAKKTESTIIEQGSRQSMILLDEGAALALRALGWGTLYAVLGTGAVCYGFWKLSGAKNFDEFRAKMGNSLPRITKDEPPTSRTDFESLTDLMKYLAAWNRE